MLFTDIVDSTVRAAEVGDRQWRAVLDEFDVNVGRLLARHDGVLVKTTGDGILARFASPAQAVRCAAAMVEAARADCNCGPGCTPARWSCGVTTSAAWRSTSRRGSAPWPVPTRCS